MSHAHGTHVNGIRDLAALHCRCRIDDDTGCWHWSLSMSQGAPRVHFKTPDTGRKIIARGRRAALYLARGCDLPKGHVAFARSNCKHDDCVNPEHSTSGSRAQHGLALATSGKTKHLATKSIASRKGWLNRRALSDEMVRDIRNSDESTYKLAARLGVSNYTVWSCRVGNSHRELMPGASVFSYRP